MCRYIMSFEIKLKYKYNENPLLYATDFIFTENYISSPQIPCHHTLSLSISLPFFLFRYFSSLSIIHFVFSLFTACILL